MIQFIAEMFVSPEAQPDAYQWAAVLLAHAAIGAILTAIAKCLPILRRRPALVVSLVYGVVWEGGQLLFAGADLADGVLDWVAVTLGAMAGQATWERHGRNVAATIATAIAILWAGVKKRR